MSGTNSLLPIVVLLSGHGSNFKAILEAIHNDGLPIEVCAVISNRADAKGLTYAQRAGIQTHALNSDDYSDRKEFDQAMQKLSSINISPRWSYWLATCVSLPTNLYNITPAD